MPQIFFHIRPPPPPQLLIPLLLEAAKRRPIPIPIHRRRKQHRQLHQQFQATTAATRTMHFLQQPLIMKMRQPQKLKSPQHRCTTLLPHQPVAAKIGSFRRWPPSRRRRSSISSSNNNSGWKEAEGMCRARQRGNCSFRTPLTPPPPSPTAAALRRWRLPQLQLCRCRRPGTATMADARPWRR